MSINLKPAPPSKEEFIDWTKQSFSLFKRDPFIFFLGIIWSSFISVLLYYSMGEVAVHLEKILGIMSLPLVLAAFIFIALSSPVGYFLTSIAESVDEGHKFHFVNESVVIFICVLKEHILFSLKLVIKPFLFMSILIGGLYFLSENIDQGNIQGAPAHVLNEKIEAKPHVAEKPILALSFLYAFPFIGFMYTMFSSIKMSPIYHLPILKGIISIELAKNISSTELFGGPFILPFLIAFISLPFVFIFPLSHWSGIVSVVLFYCMVTFLWIFYYVAARDRFLGKKKNQEVESKASEGKAVKA